MIFEKTLLLKNTVGVTPLGACCICTNRKLIGVSSSGIAVTLIFEKEFWINEIWDSSVSQVMLIQGSCKRIFFETPLVMLMLAQIEEIIWNAVVSVIMLNKRLSKESLFMPVEEIPMILPVPEMFEQDKAAKYRQLRFEKLKMLKS